MKKNAPKFFSVAVVSVIAVFMFFVVATPHVARAYAISSASGSMSLPEPALNATSGGYSFGGSLQNLFSPLEGFVQNLQWSNNTTINVHTTSSMSLPPLNIAPGLENTFEGWLTGFNNWFYGLTGVRLSGIFFILLNAILWALHLAENVVNWLLGLFY